MSVIRRLSSVAFPLLAVATLALGQGSGPLDTSFNPVLGSTGTVTDVVVQPNDRVLVAGAFADAAGTGTENLTRLTLNGLRDNTFFPGTVTGGASLIQALALQSDGKIVIGGDFTAYNGVTRNYLLRISAAGAVDAAGFSGLTGPVTAVAVQSDGKIVVGYAANTRVWRFNANGTRDTGFVTGTGAGGGTDPAVYAILQQPDGKLLIGGRFTAYGATTRINLARLNEDGTLDESFVPGNGTNGAVRALALEPDGRVLVAGDFTIFGPAVRGGVARLNADGSLDTTFGASGVGAAGPVKDVLRQSDGRIVVGGDFTTFDGASRLRIARLNSDGAVDASFFTAGGADGPVLALAQQSDGKLLLGGSFGTVNFITRPLIARLTNAVRPGPVVTNVERLPSGDFRVTGTADPSTTLDVLASTTLESFEKIGTVTTDEAGAFAFTDTAADTLPQRFYRVVYP